MTQLAPVRRSGQPWAEAAVLPILALALLCFAVELAGPLNHDVSWLLDAGSRWANGQRLYVDIVELNPPLVFYVYALITGGTFAKAAFVAGVVGMIAVSSMWAARLKGRRWAPIVFLLCVASGILDFGQRDHLAAIVAVPYLWADRAKPKERLLIGAWSFLGFGLKPHLMLIPAGATVGRMIRERSFRPAFSPENLVLAALSLAYLVAAALLYPEYFNTVIPLTRLVYFPFGNVFPGEPLTGVLLAVAVATAIASASRRLLWPETGALVGAVGSFLAQGRFWNYHLVPAIAISLLVLLMMWKGPSRRRFGAAALAAMAATMIIPAVRPDYPTPIPQGVKSVLFLSAHISAAYPAVFDRGIINASPYPQLWTLPGAWLLVHDHSATPGDRRDARAVLTDTRTRVVGSILRDCPELIFADIRRSKPFFGIPFDFVRFLAGDRRFSGYRPGKRVENYRVYHRVGRCAAR